MNFCFLVMIPRSMIKFFCEQLCGLLRSSSLIDVIFIYNTDVPRGTIMKKYEFENCIEDG